MNKPSLLIALALAAAAALAALYLLEDRAPLDQAGPVASSAPDVAAAPEDLASPDPGPAPERELVDSPASGGRAQREVLLVGRFDPPIRDPHRGRLIVHPFPDRRGLGVQPVEARATLRGTFEIDVSSLFPRTGGELPVRLEVEYLHAEYLRGRTPVPVLERQRPITAELLDRGEPVKLRVRLTLTPATRLRVSVATEDERPTLFHVVAFAYEGRLPSAAPMAHATDHTDEHGRGTVGLELPDRAEVVFAVLADEYRPGTVPLQRAAIVDRALPPIVLQIGHTIDGLVALGPAGEARAGSVYAACEGEGPEQLLFEGDGSEPDELADLIWTHAGFDWRSRVALQAEGESFRLRGLGPHAYTLMLGSLPGDEQATLGEGLRVGAPASGILLGEGLSRVDLTLVRDGTPLRSASFALRDDGNGLSANFRASRSGAVTLWLPADRSFVLSLTGPYGDETHVLQSPSLGSASSLRFEFESRR